MIALAIDTAHEFGSVALTSGSETIEEVLLHEPGGFSGVLFDRIGQLLEQHAVALDAVDIYAAAAGPGSFTGVRIALSAAKALAEASSKPCFAVSNLLAMARFGTAPARTALMDARRGEVYGAVLLAGEWTESVARFPEWLESLPEDVTEFLAFDFLPFDATLAQSRFSRAQRIRVPRALASSVALIAHERFRQGEIGDPALLDANYVRRSDAELLWKDHQ